MPAEVCRRRSDTTAADVVRAEMMLGLTEIKAMPALKVEREHATRSDPTGWYFRIVQAFSWIYVRMQIVMAVPRLHDSHKFGRCKIDATTP